MYPSYNNFNPADFAIVDDTISLAGGGSSAYDFNPTDFTVDGSTVSLANPAVLYDFNPADFTVVGSAVSLANPDAPSDSVTYGRKNGAWVAVSVSFPNADTTHTGLLTSADWNTFNAKQPALGFTPATTQTADATHTGLLTLADWATFNAKQPAGAYLLDAPSDSVTYGRKNGAWVSSAGAAIPNADTTHTGLLTSTDWNTFNAKQAALGFTPATTQTADTTHTGLLTSTDWNTFNSKASALGFTPLDANKSTRVAVLCAAFTPAATGADAAEVMIPYAANGSGLVYDVRRIALRVNQSGGAPATTIEKSTVAGIFSATTVGTVTLGSGAYEGSTTAGLGTLASGNKIRFNAVTLATAQGWTITVEITPQ